MNEDLLKEVLEIKSELRELNNRLDKVTDKLFENQKNEYIETDIHKIEESINIVEEQLKPIPIDSNTKNTPINNLRNEQPKFTHLNSMKNSNLEANIGKNVMGVLASLLIFIGIASFVVLVFQDLSEILKMCLMYVFSFGLFSLGLWRVEKNKNAFSLSLTGCGIGAVFLSILLSYFYFEIVTNQIVLFLLLLLWSIIILLLSKKYQSDLFVIISYIGYYFALLLGALSEMVIVGEPVCTIGFMLILHSLFVYLIGSKNISISDRLYKIFPFISLLGSFILILSIGNQDYFIWSILQIESIITVFAMLGQMFVSLWYIKNLTNIRVNENLLTVILLLTIFINIFGFFGLSQSYYTTTNETPDALFHTVLETEEERNNTENYYHMFIDRNEESGYLEIQNDNVITIFMILSVIIQLVFIEFINLKEKYLKTRNISLYCLTVLGAFFFCSTLLFETFFMIFGTSIIAAFLLWYGKEDNAIFKMSLIVFFIGLFGGCLEHNMRFLDNFMWAHWVFSISNLLYIIYAGVVLKNNYHLTNKVWYYILSMFTILFITNIFGDYYSNVFADKYYNYLEVLNQGNVYIQEYSIYDNSIYRFLNYDLSLFIVFIIMTIFALFVKLTGFCQNWNNNILRKSEDALDVVYNLNNGLTCILLLLGLTLVHNIEFTIIQFILILFTSLLCFIGSRELLSRNNKILEYYVGIKATLFINCAMAAFVESNMGYIYSIVCLLIAISSIMIGFKGEIKSFRLYGLILSICSVLKLLMIDISITNSMGRILTFIGAGLICFGIVWIYNKMSEKFIEESIEN